MNRYIAGFLLAVGLIVLVIILIVHSLASSPSGPTVVGPHDLTSYADTGTSVQLTIDSPVQAAQNHYDVIINVSNYQTTLTITDGYQGQTINTQTYPMSTSGYEVFLRALKFSGFDQGNNDPSLSDERGQCALGTRYIFQVIDSSNNNLQHYWTTSCGGGTFDGSTAQVIHLFKLQVPDYSKQTQNLALGAAY